MIGGDCRGGGGGERVTLSQHLTMQGLRLFTRSVFIIEINFKEECCLCREK
jgi:hypothetical protein